MPTRKQKQNMQLQEALEVIKAAGLKIASDSAEVTSKLQQQSLERLGVVEPPKKAIKYGKSSPKPKPEKTTPVETTITLVFPHTIGLERYGPGKVTIPPEKAYLGPILLQHDKTAVARENDEIIPRRPRSYMIVETNSQNAPNGLIRVDDTFYDSGNAMNDPRYQRIIS